LLNGTQGQYWKLKKNEEMITTKQKQEGREKREKKRKKKKKKKRGRGKNPGDRKIHPGL